LSGAATQAFGGRFGKIRLRLTPLRILDGDSVALARSRGKAHSAVFLEVTRGLAHAGTAVASHRLAECTKVDDAYVRVLTPSFAQVQRQEASCIDRSNIKMVRRPRPPPSHRKPHGVAAAAVRKRRRAQAESLVIMVLDEIASALERGKRVELRGVGVLTVKEKREWQGRIPRTGEALVIEPYRVVHFRASELLLARLNRPDNRRPERPKSDPRQLAFPIDGWQGEPDDTHTRPAPSRFARKRTIERKAIIYEKSD